VREVVRALCPPALWQAIARVRYRFASKPRKMFSGVYSGFADVADQHPWAQSGYHETCRHQLRECPAIHTSAVTTHALLTFLINTLASDSVPRILDWAGGTGLRFWTTRPALNRTVRWHVIDNATLAAIGEEIMGSSEELVFANELPSPGSATFDIVLVYSSLQYVEAQDALLATLVSYRPRYIVFSRLMAHAGAPYVTCQNVQGFDTPCKVSSISEITRTMASRQYDPVLMIRDGLELSPMFSEDVPDHLRVGKEWLLVFCEAS